MFLKLPSACVTSSSEYSLASGTGNDGEYNYLNGIFEHWAFFPIYGIKKTQNLLEKGISLCS